MRRQELTVTFYAPSSWAAIARGWYVSLLGRDERIVSGPYGTEREAEAAVEGQRRAARSP